MGAIEVDIRGLAAIVERPGMPSLAMELVQNALDADDVTRVEVSVEKVRRQIYRVQVVDDSPTGFRHLEHAWTMFAHTHKRADASLRGRFNIGCKRVFSHSLARGLEAAIRTTKGSVLFKDMKRDVISDCTESGTTVTAMMRMSAGDVREFESIVFDLIVPAGVQVVWDNAPVLQREASFSFKASLGTEIADDEGVLRRVKRKTTVGLYPKGTKPARLFELGIPVCDMPKGFPYDADVQQRVPLNVDRDNVTPAWLRRLLVEVFNSIHTKLDPAEMASSWAMDAAADSRSKPEAIQSFLTGKFGEKYVAFDPTDLEANKRAVAEGYTVVGGRAMTKDLWGRVKEHGLIQRAGDVTPGHKVLVEMSLDLGETVELSPDEWRKGVAGSVTFSAELGKVLLGFKPDVQIVNQPTLPFVATYGNRRLMFNVGRLGWKALQNRGGDAFERLCALLLHEFAHEKVSDHLSDKFHDECCRLGVKLAVGSMGGWAAGGRGPATVEALYLAWAES